MQVSYTAWKLWMLIQRLKRPTDMSLTEVSRALGGVSKTALNKAAFELEDAGIIVDEEV